MNANLLRRSGEALFGRFWIVPMAQTLNRSVKTIQRYAAGTHTVPAEFADTISVMIAERALEIAKLAVDLNNPSIDYLDHPRHRAHR